MTAGVYFPAEMLGRFPGRLTGPDYPDGPRGVNSNWAIMRSEIHVYR